MQILSRITVLLLVAIIVASSQASLSASPRSPQIQYLHNPIHYRPASSSNPGSPPFVPSDLWNAYDYLPVYAKGFQGAGTRIAIIDAYGDPSLASDLSTFDNRTGLPSVSVNIYYPDGPPDQRNTGWATETALDTEWAHAIAPAATIDLIIGVDNSLTHLFDSIQYVANNLPQEASLSMSWGDAETNYPTSGPYTISKFHTLFTTISNHGTALFASSGDSGSVGCCAVEYPASDPLVTGVGGTTLHLNSNSSYVSEQAWSGSGAGRSIVFAQPSWQNGLGDPIDRNSVDVSYVADPGTGVLVVYSGSSLQVGGTSAGSPQWAALAALATEANGHSYGTINPQLYKLTTYHDVQTGFNGYYSAGTGWDYPTGLGTPDAYRTVNALVSPLVVPLNDTQTFQGATVKTTGSFSISKFSDILTGTASVVVRNSTNGVPLFSKSFTLAPMQMQAIESSYSGSLIISIGNTSPPLSSNIRVSMNSGNATVTVSVTRRIDVNGDGIVNILDLAMVASEFGLAANNTGYNPSADIDGDGAVTILDLAHIAILFQSPDYI